MTLSALLLEWVMPSIPALIGWGVAMQSVRYDGTQAVATLWLGFMFMVSMPLYALWGAAKEARLQAELQEADRAWNAMKQPKAEPLTQFNYTVPATTRMLYLRLPVEPAKLKTIAAGLIAETPLPFSEPELVDKMQLLNQGEYRELKAEMVKRGLLEMKVPNAPRQGYKLSGVGRALMREIGVGRVKPEPTPLPQLS